ncbi:MAG: hypothetical protein ABIH46_02435 [Chloroflexota bacterium]
MKYVPKRAVRVRTPEGRETTLFRRGPLTPEQVMEEMGVTGANYVEHEGRRLAGGISVFDQGVGHDDVLHIKAEGPANNAQRPWYARPFRERSR